VPRADEPGAAFCLADMEARGVDVGLAEQVGGDAGMPSALVILSRESGSRTIVSTRRGCRELSAAHFEAALEAAPAARSEWLHFEAREPHGVLAMLRAVRAGGRTRPAVVSIECEKPALDVEVMAPLLRLCDVVYFSRDWVMRHAPTLLAPAAPQADATRPGADDGGSEADAPQPPADPEQHTAIRALRAVRARLDGQTPLLICGWGAHGPPQRRTHARARRRAVHRFPRPRAPIAAPRARAAPRRSVCARRPRCGAL
jgi:hypothetical protein